MPTVFRFAGLRVVIYYNDHRPAHVHVIGRGGEAVFRLDCPNGPPALREVYGMSLKQVNRIAEALVVSLDKLCADWRNIHGHF